MVKAFIYTTIFLFFCIYFNYIYNFFAVASHSNKAVLFIRRLYIELLYYYHRLKYSR